MSHKITYTLTDLHEADFEVEGKKIKKEHDLKIREILTQQAVLCTEQLPRTYEEMDRRLWQAFRLGQQYEKEKNVTVLKKIGGGRTGE